MSADVASRRIFFISLSLLTGFKVSVSPVSRKRTENNSPALMLGLMAANRRLGALETVAKDFLRRVKAQLAAAGDLAGRVAEHGGRAFGEEAVALRIIPESPEIRVVKRRERRAPGRKRNGRSAAQRGDIFLVGLKNWVQGAIKI